MLPELVLGKGVGVGYTVALFCLGGLISLCWVHIAHFGLISSFLSHGISRESSVESST